MSDKYWIKLTSDVFSDWTIGTLPDDLWRLFFEICLALEKETGCSVGVEALAWCLRKELDEILPQIARLERKKLIRCVDMSRIVVTQTIGWEPSFRFIDALLNNLPEKMGVYCIGIAGTDIRYYGASKNIKSRIRQHAYRFLDRSHPLHFDIREHGIDSVFVEVLELVDDLELLSSREANWAESYSGTLRNSSRDFFSHSSWSNDDA